MIEASNLRLQRAVHQRQSQLRRELGRQSLQAFCAIYLSEHFSLASSRMHEEIIEMLEAAAERREARIAVAAPRGHAKTTLVSLAYVLWCIAYGLEPYILLISNTFDQAMGLLRDLRRELEQNQRILEDFRGIAEPPERRPGPKIWREGEIETRNGIRIQALGASQKIRGRKHGSHRPSLILLDDIEGEQEAASEDRRRSHWDWFQSAVLKAGVPEQTNVFVIGTLVHYDSLLGRLVGIEGNQPTPGWKGRRYQAVEAWADKLDLWGIWENIFAGREQWEEETGVGASRAYFTAHREDMLAGTQVLWPQREDYLKLMEVRLSEGQRSFNSEKQNDPVDLHDATFNPEEFQYWEDEYGTEEQLLAALKPDSRMICACDPSMGKEGKGNDDTAIVVLLCHKPTKTYYVLDADIRRRKPSGTIQAILSFCLRRGFRKVVVESNQFQEFLADEVKRVAREQGVSLKVDKVHHKTEKLARIEAIEPWVANGGLRFSRRHTQLLEQLRHFPRAAHDDGPDALAMALKAATKPVHVTTIRPM